MKGRSAGVALLVVAMTSGYRSVTTILDRAARIGLW